MVMTLTFMDAIIAWARAIEKTNFTDFEVIRRRPNKSVIRMANPPKTSPN